MRDPACAVQKLTEELFEMTGLPLYPFSLCSVLRKQLRSQTEIKMLSPKKKPAPVEESHRDISQDAQTKSVAAPSPAEMPKPNTTAERWNALYVAICSGKPLKEALASVEWNIEMEPQAKRDWKQKRDARSAAVKEKIAKGEQPFAAGTRELMLFEMLKAGCTGDELKAKFGLKPGQVGNRSQLIATLTGGDLVKTARKGAVTYKIEF
jgi:hypothetical protein